MLRAPLPPPPLPLLPLPRRPLPPRCAPPRRLPLLRALSAAAPAADPPLTLGEFRAGYPLRLDADGPRTSSAERLLVGAGWQETNVMVPLRRWLARLAAKGWINTKLKTSAAAALDPAAEYIPDGFLAGAEAAIPLLLAELSRDTLPPAVAAPSRLKALLKPPLFADFDAHHAALRDMGLALAVDVKSVADCNIHDIWITFGPKTHAKSTLIRAPLVEDLGSMAIVRKSASSVLFREVTFEYAMDPDEMKPDDQGGYLSPSVAARSKSMQLGSVVGIDVLANVNLRLSISKAPASLNEEPKALWSQRISRPMLVRFEADHCSDDFDPSWRVADMDNMIASSLY
ncbi:hypothetical protein HK105_207389 [Polyrhizophydium stewartii]|uniref:Uncharacterized protein n=1 Tax=Polyrhizophydium stewartii TaxID=2732419 RepID=A0ABR4N0T6_9FUNG